MLLSAHIYTCAYKFKHIPMHSPFSHNLRGAYSGLANTARQAYNIQRHTHSCTVSYYIIRHPCYHSYTDTHNRNTHILPPAHVERHSQALSLDKRQRKRRREEAEAQGRGVEEEERYWMYLPRFWSHPSLTMVTSLMVPSRRVWCRCTPAPLREREGGGEERRREREGEEEERRGGGPALPASASLSLPSFPVHPLVRAASLLRHTHTNTRCVCILYVCVDLLPVVAYLLSSLPTSSPSSSSPPPPPPPPLSFPLQTFLLTSSDSACKEVKGEKNNNTEKSRDGFIFLPLLLVPSSSHKSFSDKTNN